MAVKKFAPTEEEIELFESVKTRSAEQPVDEEMSSLRSVFNALLRGGVKGIEAFGQALGPLQPTTLEEKQQWEEFKPTVERALPTKERFLERGIERTGEIAPFVATGGGGLASSALRSVAAGLAGETAKEIGFGPTGQAIAEIAGSGAPGMAKRIPTSTSQIRSSFSDILKKFSQTPLGEKAGLGKLAERVEKGVLSSQEQKELIDFSRKMGMPEEQIGLLVGEKSPFLTEIAGKGPKVERAFDKTYKSLNRMWDTLGEMEGASSKLSPREATKFTSNLTSKLEKLPSETRNRVAQDVREFMSSEKTGSDLMNLWKDLNYYIGKGERGLGVAKEAIKKSLYDVSPELAKDFELTNKLYGAYKDIGKRMAPNIVDSLISGGEKTLLLSGVLEGNYPMLKKILGPIAGRRLAQEFVMNPRFANLSNRMISGLNQGKWVAAERTFNQLINEISKVDAESARQLSQLEMDELKSILGGE